MESSMWCGRAARADNCRTGSRRGSRSTTISAGSSETGLGGGFMTDSAAGSGGKAARPPRPVSASSTASRSRRLKKGGPWVRRGQENQGPQASCDRRYPGVDRGLGGPSREHSGSRWGQAVDPAAGNSLPSLGGDLRGRRVCREVRALGAGLVLPRAGDRGATSQWSLRGVAEALDCGTYLRVAGKVPTIVQGLRNVDRMQRVYDPDRYDQPDGPSAKP